MCICDMMYRELFIIIIIALPPLLPSILFENKSKVVESTKYSLPHRWKRQANCRTSDFRCRNGACISFDKRCDGSVDCTDRSDEEHYLCRTMKCQEHLFRCTYGACVDGTAACNGVKDCADNSDELIPRCRNDTVVFGDKFKCDDGQMIDVFLKCDGAKNCADGSDENLRSCGSIICPSNLFQCAYGACVDEGADCNDIDECADESDESDILCNRKVPRKTTTPKPSETTTEAPTVCTVPNHPENGFYRPNEEIEFKPGNTYSVLTLNVTCHHGYKLIGEQVLWCVYGSWAAEAKCVRACEVKPTPDVIYRCLKTSTAGIDLTRPCEALEIEGTIIQPECNSPNYYSTVELQYMYCLANGLWNYIPKCEPECGTMTPKGVPLVVGGTAAERGDVPWHAGIYWKDNGTYGQICGGSLISDSIVLSAAHCFWSNHHHQLPTYYYAVAVGQLYREWNNEKDALYAQRSDAKEIFLPERFYGAALNYQHDLAVVIVKDPFVYRTYIRPVCLDFRSAFNTEQLHSGNPGKVAGWGLTTGYKGSESPHLKVLDMPYVTYEECVERTPPQFVGFVTADKFCAGYGNGTSLCSGDSGGGLAFPAQVNKTLRFYLRGIVSTSPSSQDERKCNIYGLTSFTEVHKHATFIRNYFNKH